MQHDAHGWWIAEAGAPPPLPAAEARTPTPTSSSIGGGFTGLWTAWHLLEADADARVIVLLEARPLRASGRAGATAASSRP